MPMKSSRCMPSSQQRAAPRTTTATTKAAENCALEAIRKEAEERCTAGPANRKTVDSLSSHMQMAADDLAPLDMP